MSQENNSWNPYLGYMGNYVINPGVCFGFEKEIWTNNNYIRLLNSSGIGNTSVGLNANISSYWDPFSHVALINYYEITGRQYFGRRLATQIGLGPGIQSSFTGENYVVNKDGSIKQRAIRVQSYFAPLVSLAIMIHNKDLTKTWISKMNVHVLYKYNNSVLPTFNYELIYQF